MMGPISALIIAAVIFALFYGCSDGGDDDKN